MSIATATSAEDTTEKDENMSTYDELAAEIEHAVGSPEADPARHHDFIRANTPNYDSSAFDLDSDGDDWDGFLVDLTEAAYAIYQRELTRALDSLTVTDETTFDDVEAAVDTSLEDAFAYLDGGKTDQDDDGYGPLDPAPYRAALEPSAE